MWAYFVITGKKKKQQQQQQQKNKTKRYYYANGLNKANEHGKHPYVSIAFVGMLTTPLYLNLQGSTAVGYKCC